MQLSQDLHSYRLMRDFWLRDFERDVAELNFSLRRAGFDQAGLVSCPPSVLTGDLFSKRKGDCILLMGINPAWQGDDNKAFQAADIRPSRELHKNRDFEAYRNRRAEFFRGDDAHYGKHFTRLGNALRLADSARPSLADARSYLDNQAIVLDLLPFWSRNLKQLTLNRAADAEPVQLWREVVNAVVEDFRPRALIFNTSGQRPMINTFFGVTLARIASVKPLYAAKLPDGTPIMVHSQLNAPRGASHEEYGQMVRDWTQWLSEN